MNVTLFNCNILLMMVCAIYWIFLRNDTFFRWKRFFLLVGIISAAIIPFIDFSGWTIIHSRTSQLSDAYYSVVLPTIEISKKINSGDGLHYINLLQYIYFTVAILLLCKMLWQIIRIGILIHHSKSILMEDTRLYVDPAIEAPFSFFKWIFIHPSSKKEKSSEIILHEKTHAAQFHSIDVLTAEIISILFWYNPFVWILKKEIRSNLEYLADDAVLKQGKDSKSYQYHLLEYAYPKAAATIYNNFNVSPLKKRIMMMNKKRSKESGRVKYLILLPILSFMFMVGNAHLFAQTNKVEQTPQKEKTTKPEGEEVYEVVEIMPEFPGGINSLMSYLGMNIVYPKEAIKENHEGRTLVSFVVTKDGSINNITVLKSSNYPELDNEALRVVKSMPKWSPGKNKGKVVNVRYTIPIQFKIPKEIKTEKK